MRNRSRPIIVSNGEGQTSRSARQSAGMRSEIRSFQLDSSGVTMTSSISLALGDPDELSTGPSTAGRPALLRRADDARRPRTPVQGWRRIASAISAAAFPVPTITARRRGCGSRSSSIRQSPATSAADNM